MSDKWLSDDELNNLLGQNQDREEESELTEDLLSELLSEEKKDNKKQKRSQKRENNHDEDYEDNTYKQEVEVRPVVLEEFEDEYYDESEFASLELLRDIPMEIRVLLGSVEMTIEEILELEKGSIVKLEKLAGEPVEVYVGEMLIAKGETVIDDERFCVLITEIVSPRERVKIIESNIKRVKQ